MNNKKAKKIRKEVRAKMPNAQYAEYDWVPGNPDIDKRIEAMGLDNITKILGYAPLTCKLMDGCLKFAYKEAKACL